MSAYRRKYGINLNNMKNLPYFQPDLYGNMRIKLTRLQYQIFYFLIKKNLSQNEIAKKLGIGKQTVNEYVKKLIILGVIKENEKSSYPKYYKPTHIIPVTDFTVGKKGNVIISRNAKHHQRRVGNVFKAVRDHKTGRFKGIRRPRGEGFHRDYDTIISVNGKRVPVLRIHSLAYTCTILREPMETIPWEKVGAPKGMEQFVYRHTFSNSKSEVDSLKELVVTFVRQKTGTYDELVIYMPEKYLFEHELIATKKILDDYVWVARKWFQNRFKTWLGLAMPYRLMEVARELNDPRMKHFVEQHGMLKVKTRNGFAMVDESQKGFPEKEFIGETAVDEIAVDLHVSERVLALEQMLSEVMRVQRELLESQKQFFDIMGIRQQDDLKRKQEGIDKGIA